jgi:hypothetical protein
VSLLSLLRPWRSLPPAPCVAVVVPDGPDAVPLVARAARAAEDEHLPLLLLVPLPRTGSTGERRRHEAEAAAVLGRVAPTLALTHVELSHRVVPHPDRGGSRRQVALGGAVCAAALRHGAVLLVAPEGLPVPPPAPRVLRVPAPSLTWGRA